MSRDILPLRGGQPEPVKVKVVYLPIGRPTSTAVFRKLPAGSAGLCGLCRHCTADADGECLVGINRVVGEAEAKYLSDRDCDWFAIPGPAAEPIRARSS